MSRPLRIQFEDAFYHLTSRGNAQRDIYLCDPDRTLFLDALKETIESSGWICHGYCLMTNHYHLLVETPRANLSEGMHHLNGQYSQSFNRKHRRSGHVFQGRFDSRIVEKDSYLLAVARYVVQNPVRAGVVERPEDWPWSSYLPTASKSNWVTFLHREFLLSCLSDDYEHARREYVEFVAKGFDVSPWENLRGGVLLGSEQFIQRMQPLFADKFEESEVPKRQRLATRRPLPEVFTSLPESRDRLIGEAYFVHGYTMRAIGGFLGLSEARVSQILKASTNDPSK